MIEIKAIEKKVGKNSTCGPNMLHINQRLKYMSHRPTVNFQDCTFQVIPIFT